MRSRAEEAITSIQDMQSFASGNDLSELPELFQDSSQLPQAAVGLVLMMLNNYAHQPLWSSCCQTL